MTFPKHDFVALAIFLSSVILFAQSEYSDTELLAAIRRGQPDAMLDAGRRNLTQAVPLLKQQLKSKDWYSVHAAQMALAKMGDLTQQQQMYCTLLQGYEGNAILLVEEDLPYIDGWFSYRLLNEVAERRLSASLRSAEPPSDVSNAPPSYYALASLQKMLATSSNSSSSTPLTIDEWRKFFTAHEAELRGRAPYGDGVTYFASACKHGRARKAPR